jgi:hypothetical protein
MTAACVDSILQLGISAEAIHTASHFKPLSEYKTRIPVPLFQSMTRCQSGSLLKPLTSVFCTIASRVPYSIVQLLGPRNPTQYYSETDKNR